MRTHVCTSRPGILLLSLLVLAAVRSAVAQDPNTYPSVTIHATDAQAGEGGSNTGTFTVRRAGSTNFPTLVFYQLSGTASNGVDYESLGNTVQIPAGALTASFSVKPVDDSLVEGDETVVAQIVGSPLDCATCGYDIGVPGNAVVVIADKNSPVPAGVNIYATDPDASEIFSAPNIDPPSNPAIFTARRFGETNDGIVVYYEITGTASNGVDYVRLPGQVTIPAGAASAQIVVQPIDDTLVEGTETVVLTLLPTCPQCLFANPPCLPPQGTNCYPIGPDNRAVAYIHDNDPGTNRTVPAVNIVARDPIASEGTNFWLRDWDANRWTIDTWNAWHVNLGKTNTATFVVRRHGATDDSLTVSYDVSGTASNGADYVALPGLVTIPAGKHSAQILVTPLDDTLAEGIETVVLTLRPAPAYTVGSASRAAAILIDNDRPRPPCLLLHDRLFHLCGPGTNGFCFRVEASSDLLHWSPLCTNVVTDGALHFVDPDSPPLNTRYYRTAPELALPPDD